MSPVCSICFAAALRLSWCSYSSSLHHRTEMMPPSSSQRDDVVFLSCYAYVERRLTPCFLINGHATCWQEVRELFIPVDEVLDTEYWMMLPIKDIESPSYKISNRWIIQLRRIILGDQIWRSVKRRSDELYSRGLAFSFQSSYTCTSLRRWDAGRPKPCLIRPAIET
jgi:hypothetical protein